MSPTDASENEIPLLDREEMRVIVDDGQPVLELPNGQEVRLNIHVTEWTHEEPMGGENVDMKVEADYDDFAWWTLYPERTDYSAVEKHKDFPMVTIEPEVRNPGDRDE